MIAKIIAYGRTRDEALARLRRALAETTVIIEGGATNKSFVLDLLDQPELIDGSADTGWIDRVRTAGAAVLPPARRHRPGRRRDRGLRGGGAGRAPAAARDRPRRPAAGPARGRPRRSTSSCAGSAHRVTVAQIGPHRFRVGVGAAGATRRPSTPSSSGWTPTPAGWSSATSGSGCSTATHGPVPAGRGRRRHPPRQPRRGRRHALARARARGRHPGAGRRRGRGRRAGDGAGEHEDGDGAARAVRGAGARAAGVLRQPGRDRYAAGAAGAARRRRGRGRREEAPETAADLELPGRRRDASAYDRAVRGLDDLRSLLLGFDLDPRDEGRTLSGYLQRAGRAGRAGLRPVAAETDVLRVFADLSELSRNRPAGEETRLRRPGAQPARALPHLPAEPRRRPRRPARGVPHPAGAGPRALRRHRPRPHPRAGGGGLPHLPGPAAHGLRRRRRHRAAAAVGRRGGARAGGSPTRSARSSTGWCSPPSCASRWSATSPAASGSAGSTSRWCEAERGDVLAGVRRELSYLAAEPDARGPRRPHRRAGRDPRADRAVPRRSGSSTASPSASRCSRRSPAATTASTSCTTCAP